VQTVLSSSILSGMKRWRVNQTFILPNGQTVQLDKQVHPAYDNLFTNWVDGNGGGTVGFLVAAKAALADAKSYYMGWFAQRHAFQSGAQVIVFGHTHTPISRIDYSFINYANSGFECPSTAAADQFVVFLILKLALLIDLVLEVFMGL
jgi:hypothetical protein